MAEHQNFRKINRQMYCYLIGVILIVFLLPIVCANSVECGTVKIKNIPLILNGEDVHRGSWPFIAALYYKPHNAY